MLFHIRIYMNNSLPLSFNKRVLKSNKNKGLSLKSISNISKLHKFMEKEYDDFNMTIVPPDVKLYQGTTFNFNNKTIDDYYDYYDTRHNSAYFVSTQKVASNYGLNIDLSNIIYTTVPDNTNINKPVNIYDDIYALYYIPDIKGSNIKYKTKGNIILLNIGNKKNIEKLWNIINELFTDKNKNEEFKDILFNTVLKYDKTNNYHTFSGNLYRRSFDQDDDELVNFFIKYLVSYFKSKYNIHLNGWIYYRNEINQFADEICILNKNVLQFIERNTLPKSVYQNIPTRDEFLKTIKNRKIKNNSTIKSNTILSNFSQVKALNSK